MSWKQKGPSNKALSTLGLVALAMLLGLALLVAIYGVLGVW